ncbi:SH3 domain-binding glutamic acid-rich protein homolog [Tetranychus urticae]|uniref:SH3 domain-binding glutamic acid-rich-like protein n=1 Tax=Tetranychus urticae TaxID=32264 RepID=T1KNG5_TETUR|nr:SH3 domain-binding glutamic acid-rich protein homolog [Tetranychus urticae]
MVVKIFVSGISASKEVKKHQQRAQFILDSFRIEYEKIDVTEPGFEAEKQLMKEVCKRRNDQTALPPQFFNDDEYCGDWIDFETASEEDILPEFLKLKESPSKPKESEEEHKEDDKVKDKEPDEESDPVNGDN